MVMEPGGTTLQAAIEKLAAAKAEHRAILQQVAGDPGMSPETRRTLVEHLWSEEDEHVRRIAALAGAQLEPRAAPAEAGSSGGRLTVGSLRAEAPLTVRLGSLRIPSAEGDPA